MADRRVRIALVIDLIDHLMGGTERQLILLARGLDPGRFEPWVISLSPTRWQAENPEGLRIRTFPATRLASPRTWWNMLRLVRFLRRERIDIVQTHFATGNAVGTLCASLAGGCLVVSTRRGVRYWSGRPGLLRLRWLDRFAAGFIANSRWAAQGLIEHERVDPHRIRVIPNGLRVPASPPAEPAGREGLLRAHGLDPAQAHVVAVGNLRRVKRHDLLIRAAAVVRRSFPDARFVIVGDGPLAGALAAQAEAEGAAGGVVFLGRREGIGRLLRACDIGVLCSDSESLSNAILEYMAAGLPVVCTDVGGNPELVRDGVNGFLTPPGDAAAAAERILTLLEDRALAVRMGAASLRIVAEGFSPEAMVRSTAGFYEELLAARRARR